MSKKKFGFITLFIVAVIAVLFVVGYNSFVRLDEEIKVKWNEIQNAYQRRSDLIPNLTNIIKGSTEYEQNTLKQLTEARAKAGQVSLNNVTYDAYQQQELVQGNLTININRLIALVQRYPNLQSTNQFKTLQTQLEGTERRIKFARKDFNEAVATYNKKARSFPWNIIGGVMGFKQKEGFKADTGTEKVPEVTFN